MWGPKWEGAGAVNLLLNLGRELSTHSGQLELGGEGQSRKLGLLGILERERLKSDETEWGEKDRIRLRSSPRMMAVEGLGHVLFLGVGSDGRVRGELELADGGDIGRGGNQLKGGLLLRVSDVNGDPAGTIVLQGRSRIGGIFNPLDNLLLTSLPRGGLSWGSGLHPIHG